MSLVDDKIKNVFYLIIIPFQTIKTLGVITVTLEIHPFAFLMKQLNHLYLKILSN